MNQLNAQDFHILIVEDDKEIRDGIEIYLANQGYQVHKAADGVEGLAEMEKQEIHLAIVDIMMPSMDGITMTMKLREKYDFCIKCIAYPSLEFNLLNYITHITTWENSILISLRVLGLLV